MTHDPHGKQARLQRIAQIRRLRAEPTSLVPMYSDTIAHMLAHTADLAPRELVMREKFGKLLRSEWHDDAYV